MRWKSIFCVAAMLMGTTTLLAAARDGNPARLSAKFAVSSPTLVPGATLSPGTYSIRVLDHLSDRMIVEINGPNKVHTMFLGLPNAFTPKSRPSSGKIDWNKGPDGKAALRGFSFPSGRVVEFVYPKATAVSLAKLNTSQVPAIDPASEGRPTGEGLSKDDMQMVTLWMLSSTEVGPNDTAPTIKAEKYKQMASLHQKPPVARLPQTASYLPLIWLLAAFSLFGAAALRGFRVAAE